MSKKNSEILQLSNTTADSELEIISESNVRDRLYEFKAFSQALRANTSFRVILPEGYDSSDSFSYPVLYLLHGAGVDIPTEYEGFKEWTEKSDIEGFSATLPGMIIVTPDGGQGGMYADWYIEGLNGNTNWESYHITELIPWMDKRFRTRRDRGGRILAGESMGGFGAFSYAALYPDLFGSVAGFSPAVDTNTNLGIAVVQAAESADNPGNFGSIFGPRLTEEIRWRGHNPLDLAENLGNTEIYLFTKDGEDPSLRGVPLDPLEVMVHEMATNLHERLDVLGISHSFEDQPGTHSWPYWQEDLHKSLPQQLSTALGSPSVNTPPFVTYKTIRAQFSVFDWIVTLQREVLEFSLLEDANISGFKFYGSGVAKVTTPRFYLPNQECTVEIDSELKALASDGYGRLAIEVNLGAVRDIQEYQLGSPSGFITSVTVNIIDCTTQ